MQEKNVLIVEDDPEITDLIALHLRDMGLHTSSATTGTEGLRKALTGEYELVILDLMLPELDGLEVCRRLREQDSYTPVLMLTAKSQELDKVVGLEVGADDYVTKPFSVRELVARVRAIIRRVDEMRDHSRQDRAAGRLSFGDLALDLSARRVFVEGKPVELTTKEFDLLALLAQNAGQAFSRSQLLDQVWGYQYEGYNHTVNSHVNRLRAKIEKDPSTPRYVRTVWGFGYRFADPQEEDRWGS